MNDEQKQQLNKEPDDSQPTEARLAEDAPVALPSTQTKVKEAATEESVPGQVQEDAEPSTLPSPPALLDEAGLAEPAESEPEKQAKPFTSPVMPEVDVKTESALPGVEPEKETITPSPPSAKIDQTRQAANPPDFSRLFSEQLTELRQRANQKRQTRVEENMKKIIDFAKAHNRIDNKDARELTGLSKSRARFYLNKLEKQGKMVQFGRQGPKVFYKPATKL